MLGILTLGFEVFGLRRVFGLRDPSPLFAFLARDFWMELYLLALLGAAFIMSIVQSVSARSKPQFRIAEADI